MRRGLQITLLRLAKRAGAADKQFYADGIWHSADASCWRCNVAPGTAAAVLWNHGIWRRSFLRKVAIGTFSTAIAQHQRPDGSFGPPNANEANSELSTVFFGTELGVAFLELRETLDSATKKRWLKALLRAARYLSGRSLEYYVNGNINLANTLLYALAAEASGRREFETLERRAWLFSLHPGGGRWAGLGLKRVTKPRRRDCSDGRAFLTEDGGKGPGYDAEYTVVQATAVARIFAVRRTNSERCVLNMLVNQSLRRVTRESLLKTDGGSRHPEPNRVVPFLTPAVSLLAYRGGRRDLRRAAQRQVPQLTRLLKEVYSYSYANLYKEVSGVATILMALAEPGR